MDDVDDDTDDQARGMEELMRTLKQGSGTKQVLECHRFVIVIDIDNNNCADDDHHSY